MPGPVWRSGGCLSAGQTARRGGTAILQAAATAYGHEPGGMVTHKLCSYRLSHRELISASVHSTEQYKNNRAGYSHGVTGLSGAETARVG